MNIIDSSCWIEYLMDSEIGASIAPIVESTKELIVPTITAMGSKCRPFERLFLCLFQIQ